MKKLLVLLAAVCAVSVLAEGTLVYSIGFETSEGYAADKDLIEQGWRSIWSGVGRDMVRSDATEAPSGTQYVVMGNDDESQGANCSYVFNISSQYKAGQKVRISWNSKNSTTSGKVHYVKLHNLGTSGQNYDVEIAEMTIQSSGWSYLAVCKEDKTSTSVSKLIQAGAWHDFSLTIDPATHKIMEYVIDDNVVLNGTENYCYKSDKGDGIAGRGDLIDGVRLMNFGAFDNFQVEVVPEPAFFGLIALLGLFFARKQR